MDFRFWTLGFKLLGVSFLVFLDCAFGDFRFWVLDFGFCALGFGLGDLDLAVWASDFGSGL